MHLAGAVLAESNSVYGVSLGDAALIQLVGRSVDWMASLGLAAAWLAAGSWHTAGAAAGAPAEPAVGLGLAAPAFARHGLCRLAARAVCLPPDLPPPDGRATQRTMDD